MSDSIQSVKHTPNRIALGQPSEDVEVEKGKEKEREAENPPFATSSPINIPALSLREGEGAPLSGRATLHSPSGEKETPSAVRNLIKQYSPQQTVPLPPSISVLPRSPRNNTSPRSDTVSFNFPSKPQSPRTNLSPRSDPSAIPTFHSPQSPWNTSFSELPQNPSSPPSYGSQISEGNYSTTSNAPTRRRSNTLGESAPVPTRLRPNISPREEPQCTPIPEPDMNQGLESKLGSGSQILLPRRSSEGEEELSRSWIEKNELPIPKGHFDPAEKKGMRRSRSMNAYIDDEDTWSAEGLLPLDEDRNPSGDSVGRPSPPSGRTYHARIRGMVEIPEFKMPGKKYNPSRFNSAITPRTVTKSTIREQMDYLPQISSIRFFKINEAERQLSNCIKCFPGREVVIMEYLMQIRGSLTKAHHKDRFDKVIALALSREGNEEFICLFFQEAGFDIPEFTKKVVNEFFKKKDLYSIILPAILRITAVELNVQRRNELFRNDGLSSCLCRDFANLVWKRGLAQLRRVIVKELKNSELSHLCLDRKMLVAQLKESDPDFEKLDHEVQLEKVQDLATSNVEHFEHFAKQILPKIFSMHVPEQISKMLTARRGLIMGFLEAHPREEDGDLKDLSRPYIAEIVTLRILNPYISKIDYAPEKRCVLISLTKVLQCCAKETPFGDEKQDSIYKMLNPLFKSSFKDYCDFIDLHSLEKSD